MAKSLLAALLVGIAAAQTTTTTLATSTSAGSYITTLGANGFLQGSLAASIIGGDACRTTYEVKCVASRGCASGMYSAPSGFSVTVTEGPYFQAFSTAVTTLGATVSLSESCNVSGRTSVTCTASLSEAYGGASTSSTIMTSFAAKYGSVTVTAGNIPTGSCTSTGNAAIPTAFVDVVKVAVVPVAALAAALV